MRINGKKLLSFGGIALSAGLLIYLFSKVDINAFWTDFKRANPLYLVPLALLMTLQNVFRALRWKLLLPQSKTELRFSVKNLFESILVGFTATFLLPLRAGEFVRAFYLSKIEPVSFTGSFASIVTERVFDIFALLVLFSACAGFMPNVPPLVAIGAKSLCTVTVAGIFVIALAYRYPRTILKLVFAVCRTVSLGSRLTKRILGMAKEFLAGLQSISSISRLFLVLLYSGLLWLTVCCFYWVAIQALQIEGTFLMGAVITVVVAFAVAAPSAPGFLGTYQAGCVIALSTIFGFSESFAIAYSIFTHLVQAVFVIGLGLYFLARRGMNLGELTKARPDEKKEPTVQQPKLAA